MISLRRWFFLYGVVPFVGGVAAVGTIGGVYLLQTLRASISGLSSVTEELTKVLTIAHKQKSQELHDFAFNSFLNSHPVTAITYCSGPDVLFNWPYEENLCLAEDSGIFTITKLLPYSSDARLIVKFSGAPFFKILIPSVIAYIFLIALAVLIGVRLRRRLGNDLLSIVNVDSDEFSQSQIFEIQELFEKIKVIQKNHYEAERIKSLQAIYSQVAHDIRSPLSALSMVTGFIGDLSEEKRHLIRNAVQRINDIANQLLQKGKDINVTDSIRDGRSSDEPVMLVALLDSIVSEKRVQFREKIEVEIQVDLTKGYGIFAKINGSELARVISNGINNAVESFRGPGKVVVNLFSTGDKIEIHLSDNGRGIPPHVLKKLGQKGVSYGKEGTSSGSGLGVYHAKTVVESAGGEYKIQSVLEEGTTIVMILPRVAPPSWFIEKLRVPVGASVVIIDDDQTIHQVWNERFRSIIPVNSEISFFNFTSIDLFEEWLQTNSKRNCLFFMDYEFLKQKGNGLDVIERNGIAEHALLVTSHFSDESVRQRAEFLGVKILPKGLAPYVPLEVENIRQKYDSVVIDDDSVLIHAIWQMAAERENRKVKCFATPDEFYLDAKNIDLKSPLFIDVNLGKGIRGEDVSRKVASLGFNDITLTTGYDVNSISVPSCVKKIVGKDPLFEGFWEN